MAVRTGTAGSDILEGTNEADTINGLGGDDFIDAGERSAPPATAFDSVDGGAGTDTLQVVIGGESPGDVTLFISGPTGTDVTVRSGSGNYAIDAVSIERIIFFGGNGNDTFSTGDHATRIHGGSGLDHWIGNYSAFSQAMTFRLVTGTTTLPRLNQFEAIERVTLTTGSGNDLIDTGGGNQGDTLSGGAGDDIINAGARSPSTGTTDFVDGGAGIDRLVVDASESETQSVTLGLSGPTGFFVRSTSGNFFVDAVNVERVSFVGGSGNDTIDTGNSGVKVRGGNGIDHWLADLSALTTDVLFQLPTTTRIDDAGLNLIDGIERLTLITGSGNDDITAGDQADSITTGAGNDTIDVKNRPTGGGTDFVDAGAGTDTLVINTAAESQDVTLGPSGPGSFFLRSNSGNFFLDAVGIEKIRFTGGGGNDLINTGNSAASLDGRTGIDHWIADLSAITTDINFALGVDGSIPFTGVTSIFNIERMTLTTGSGNDRISGAFQGDSITTGAGNDTIDARTRPVSGATDFVDAGTGVDTLIVNASAETQGVLFGVTGPTSFFIRSTSNNFFVDAVNIERVAFTGGSGDDTVNTDDNGVKVVGGGGIDHWLADLSALTTRVVFTLGATDHLDNAGLKFIDGIERITLTTGSGNDIVTGGSREDTITTGAGADIIDLKTRPVGGGTDFADGGAGNDTLVIDASAETQGLLLGVSGPSNFFLRSGSGNFFADTANTEKVSFTGGAGNDTASGNAGADILIGLQGSDTLVSGGGSDTVKGGPDNDVLGGGTGADELTGGSGADIFDYNSITDSSVASSDLDTVFDFASGLDEFDVSDIDANGSADGDPAFTFIGTHGFNGIRGELRAVAGSIAADVNGDGSADFRVLLANGATAHLGDFVL